MENFIKLKKFGRPCPSTLLSLFLSGSAPARNLILHPLIKGGDESVIELELFELGFDFDVL